MAVAFRSATSGTVSSINATTYTVARPANVADGDLLVMLLSQITTAPNTYMVIPAGWTAGTPASFGASGTDWGAWAWKIASGEPANYTMTNQAGGWAGCSILAFTGVNPSLPFSADFADWIIPAGAEVLAEKTTPSVTPDTDNAYVVRLVASGKGNPGPVDTAQSWTPPAGYTELLDYGPAGNHYAQTAAGRQLSGGANTATGTADFALSSPQMASFGTTVALRPASSAVPSTRFTRVQAASNGGVAASLSVTLPKTPTPGNLLVCWWSSGAACTLSNSGWTAGPRVDANVGSAMYYKIATSADTATVTFTLSRNDVTAGFVEYSGNTATPFDKQATSSVLADNGAYSITAVSAQTTAANDLVVSLAALRAAATSGNPTNPAWTGGLANVLAQGDGQSAASNATCYSYYGDNLNAGPAATSSVQASWSKTMFKQRTGLVMTFQAAGPTRTANRGAFFAFS